MIGILQSCIPIIVGALIAIVPTLIEKCSEQKNNRVERVYDKKQELYVELVTLLGKVLKRQHNSNELDLLINHINLISVTGSVAVVKALHEYLDTWGSTSGEEQKGPEDGYVCLSPARFSTKAARAFRTFGGSRRILRSSSVSAAVRLSAGREPFSFSLAGTGAFPIR